MLGIDFKKLEEIKDKQEVIDFLVDNNIIKAKPRYYQVLNGQRQ